MLNGFGAGPAEVCHCFKNSLLGDSSIDNLSQTSQPEISADIIFLHERGAYNTLYFTAYFGSMIVRRSTHL